jgi:undecaprenyl-diphosphatase
MPSIENSFLISISKAIGFVFDTISLVIISLILSIILWLKNYKKQALFFSITNLIAAAIIYLAKEIIHRVRPENILINETNSSFPSGHATIAVVFFGLLIYLAMKKKNEIRSSKLKIVTSIISVFMILIIGFSRLYLNAHWLSDIIAGYCLGLFVLTSAIIFREKIFSN